MRIWKLTPTKLTDPIWRKWSPEPIIVRAESEAEARDWAKLKTMKTFRATSGLPIPSILGAGIRSKIPARDRLPAKT
jgi:hypothetical protein